MPATIKDISTQTNETKRTYSFKNGKWVLMTTTKNVNKNNLVPAKLITSNYYKGVPHSRIEELDEKSSKDFMQNTVYVIEKLKGKHLRIIHEGDRKVILGDKYSILKKGEIYYRAKETFMNQLEVSFVNLIKELREVPFTLFCEIISKETENGISYVNDNEVHIVCYDIHLNSHWMHWDDFIDLMEKCGFKTPPVLLEAVFDKQIEQIIKDFIGTKSRYEKTKQDLEGVIIRPWLERSVIGYDNSSRLIAKITDEKYRYIPPPKLPKKDKKKDSYCGGSAVGSKHPARIAYDILSTLSEKNSEDFNLLINLLLEEKKVENAIDDSIKNLYVLIEAEIISMLEDDIAIEAALNNSTIFEIKKHLRTQLEKKIEKSFRILKIDKK